MEITFYTNQLISLESIDKITESIKSGDFRKFKIWTDFDGEPDVVNIWVEDFSSGDHVLAYEINRQEALKLGKMLVSMCE